MRLFSCRPFAVVVLTATTEPLAPHSTVTPGLRAEFRARSRIPPHRPTGRARGCRGAQDLGLDSYPELRDVKSRALAGPSPRHPLGRFRSSFQDFSLAGLR